MPLKRIMVRIHDLKLLGNHTEFFNVMTENVVVNMTNYMEWQNLEASILTQLTKTPTDGLLDYREEDSWDTYFQD